MSWLRIDDGFTHHNKLLALKTDSRRWTWLCVLTRTCRFKSPVGPAEIGHIIPKATRSFLADCVAIGLIDVEPEGGTMTVHDWHDYQAGDPKKALRQASWRKKVDGDVDAPVDGDVDAGSGERDADVDASRVGARARPVPSPSQRSSLERPAFDLDVGKRPGKNGHGNEPIELPYFARLHEACGGTDEAIAKLRRAAKGKPQARIVLAYEACTGPGVRDPLAVALATLAKKDEPPPVEPPPSDDIDWSTT